MEIDGDRNTLLDLSLRDEDDNMGGNTHRGHLAEQKEVLRLLSQTPSR